MISYALAGQIVIAMGSSHLGWFNLPVRPITMVTVVGVIALLVGVLLSHWESSYAQY